MSCPRVVNLAEIQPGARAEYGGKAVHLAGLSRRGYPVPPAVVIGTVAYPRFARAPRIQAAVRAAKLHAGYPAPAQEPFWDLARLRILQEPLPDDLRREILAALAERFPNGRPALAVRSSAPEEDAGSASYAGIYRSVLGVTDDDALWDAIRACWSALWSMRAVEYRARAGTKRAPAMAVIIQQLVKADAAGVAFSRDPATGEARVVINAVRGLGEGLVSGWLEPERKILSPAESQDLAARVTAIERALGAPQDVEWARQDGRWWFVQTRPITSINCGLRSHPPAPSPFDGEGETWNATAGKLPTPPLHRMERGPGGEVRAHIPQYPWGTNLWSTANVGEVLPGVVTPLTGSGMEAGLIIAFLANFRRMGLALSPHLPIVRAFLGRFYFNVAALQWISWRGWGMTPGETNRTMGGNQPAIALPDPGTASWSIRLGWLFRQLRAGLNTAADLRRAPARFRCAEAALASAMPDSPAAMERLTDLQLLELLFAARAIFDRLFPVFLSVSALTSAILGQLQKLAARWLPGEDAGALGALLAGQGDITSAEHGYDLARIAAAARAEPQAAGYLRALLADPARPVAGWREALRGTRAGEEVERFLRRYGHRAVREWELAEPRWREDPGYILRTAALFLDTSPPIRPKPGSGPLRHRLRTRSPLLGPLRAAALVRGAREYGRAARLREAGKSLAVRITSAGRDVTLVAAQRLVERAHLEAVEDVFFLERGEFSGVLLGEVRPDTLRELVARRRERARAWEAVEPPPVIFGDELPQGAAPAPGLAGAGPQAGWTGLALSPGRAAGRARVLLSPVEGHRLQHGEVLVAPYTDPAWTPLFLRASALVMEIGGFLSHGSIVAREYGIPAVANLPGITRSIPDGAWLVVDGGTGQVSVRIET